MRALNNIILLTVATLKYDKLVASNFKFQFSTFSCLFVCWPRCRPLRSPRARGATRSAAKLIIIPYSKKITVNTLFEKHSLLTKLAKCTANIALKVTLSVFSCVCVCLFLCVLTAFQACKALFNAFLERQVFTQISGVVQAVGLSWWAWATCAFRIQSFFSLNKVKRKESLSMA